MHCLSSFSLSDMLQMSAALRKMGANAATLSEVAQHSKPALADWAHAIRLARNMRWNVLLPDPHLLDPQKWIQLPQRRCVETEAAPYGSGHAAAAVVECLAGEIRR